MHTPSQTVATDTFTRQLPAISTELAGRGWSVTRDFLPGNMSAQLRTALLSEWLAGTFRHAGVGRGSNFEINPAIRNDQVSWLCADTQGAFRDYLAVMDELRKSLNRELYLGLFDYEAHLAVYPPGAAYKKHLDQFRGIGLRTVTTTLYLNDNWQMGDGGQLRLYLDDTDPLNYMDVLPEAGTLVTFLSAQFLHEVLPARRERLSITGWFKVRDLNANFQV